MTRPWSARLHVRDRLRVLTDERRWRDYVRVPGSPSIFYRAQPQGVRP